tara:strand:- start:902 stop:1027 length:126 start_codon:yes stop_codon:yes gene_type:complete
MKKNRLIIIMLIILLSACGRKGDLLPPPAYNDTNVIFLEGK